MVEIKSMKLEQHHFLGMHLLLPRFPVYLIISTKSILVPDIFSHEFFEMHEKPVSVLITSYCDGFDQLLMGTIISCNAYAGKKGVVSGMPCKEALMLCET